MNGDDGRLLIAIPCYNESENIGDLLTELADVDQPWEIVVIDDGSTDGTAEKIPPGVRVLRSATNAGVGAAVGQAVRIAREEGFDFVLQLDGDGQHPPAEIEALLTVYRSHPTDIVIGSRFGTRNAFRSTWDRRAGIRLIRGALSTLFGLNVTDPTSGFRLLNRRAIDFFASGHPPLYPEPVSLARAVQAGLTISEVSVRMRPRRHGKSSIEGFKKATYILNVIRDLVSAKLSVPAGRLETEAPD